MSDNFKVVKHGLYLKDGEIFPVEVTDSLGTFFATITGVNGAWYSLEYQNLNAAIDAVEDYGGWDGGDIRWATE